MEDRNVKVPMVGDVWRWSAPSGICYKITRIEQTGAIYARRNDAGPTERGKQVAADAVDLNKHWTFVRRAEPTSPAKPESSEPAQVVPMVGDVWRGKESGAEWTVTHISQTGEIHARLRNEAGSVPVPFADDADQINKYCDFVSRRQAVDHRASEPCALRVDAVRFPTKPDLRNHAGFPPSLICAITSPTKPDLRNHVFLARSSLEPHVSDPRLHLRGLRLLANCVFIRRAEPTAEPEPSKPAPTCEAPGWLGRSHAVDATDYGVCRVCGSSESDRRSARRRAFEPDTIAWTGEVGDDPPPVEAHWVAFKGGVEGRGLTEALAVEALWAALESKR